MRCLNYSKEKTFAVNSSKKWFRLHKAWVDSACQKLIVSAQPSICQISLILTIEQKTELLPFTVHRSAISLEKKTTGQRSAKLTNSVLIIS